MSWGWWVLRVHRPANEFAGCIGAKSACADCLRHKVRVRKMRGTRRLCAMLTHKGLIALRYISESVVWMVGLLYIVSYVVVLIPYYSNCINEWSDGALKLVAYSWIDPEVAKLPAIESVYGSQGLAEFAFWIGGLFVACFFIPLLAVQAYILLAYWHDFSHRGRAWRIGLHVALAAVGIIGILNASKFLSWMET